MHEGSVEEATRLLGRYPSVSGEVVSGAQRGHKLGFPTANLAVRPERAIPADGIYAVFAWLGEERYPAVASIGVRPTFDGGERTIEAYILDFDHNIYGCDLVVEFVARLRDERYFEHVEALVDQIEHDVVEARQILSRIETQSGSPAQASQEHTAVGCRHGFQEIEHTADRALKVWGENLPALYAAAAQGMYSLMGDLHEEGLLATEWREVSLEALDRESLLVDWLNELLFLAEMEGLLFLDFRIRSLTETALVALAGGVRAPVTKADIKAATFHDLEIVQDESGWSTVITFDV
jgi:SHS2 domain-containing protein